MTKNTCKLCDLDTIVSFKSPQPDDKGGVEVVIYRRCSYCGAEER